MYHLVVPWSLWDHNFFKTQAGRDQYNSGLSPVKALRQGPSQNVDAHVDDGIQPSDLPCFIRSAFINLVCSTSADLSTASLIKNLLQMKDSSSFDVESVPASGYAISFRTTRVLAT